MHLYGNRGKPSPTQTFCVLPAPPCVAWGSQRFTKEPDSCGAAILVTSLLFLKQNLGMVQSMEGGI